MITLLKELGPLGYLTIAIGGAGVAIALATLVLLLLVKKPAAKVTGVLCLLAAGAALAMGTAGHFLALETVTHMLGNVPFDVRAELLLKGTLEARSHLLVAMLAAALPLVVGALAMLVTRSGVGGGLALLVAGGLALTLHAYAAPLPPGKTTFVEVDGIRLPNSTAARRPSAQPLLALTPGGLWLEGTKVESLAVALEDSRVREQNPDVLPLAVDARVPFSKLADVLEAGGVLKRHDFDVVVQAPSGELAVIRIRNAHSIPPDGPGLPPLNLTVRLSETQAQVLATGAELQAQPLSALAVRMKEIKSAFPAEVTIRVTAAAELSMDALVAALDVIRETEDRKLLFPDIVIGRFESPVVKRAPRDEGVSELNSMRPRVAEQPPEFASPEVDREKLAIYVRARRGAIQSCYEHELRRAPKLQGKMVVLFSISPAGRAIDLGNEAVATCVQAVISKWVFPFKPETAVEVAYPFVFSVAQ
jgi:hypothetical protein